jgi:hypothetical protein
MTAGTDILHTDDNRDRRLACARRRSLAFAGRPAPPGLASPQRPNPIHAAGSREPTCDRHAVGHMARSRMGVGHPALGFTHHGAATTAACAWRPGRLSTNSAGRGATGPGSGSGPHLHPASGQPSCQPPPHDGDSRTAQPHGRLAVDQAAYTGGGDQFIGPRARCPADCCGGRQGRPRPHRPSRA